MVQPRRRVPTPAWAELPPDCGGFDAFQPFTNGLMNSRVATPLGTAPFGSVPQSSSVLIDEDKDAPQLGLF
jgi:hypothetical protein